MGVFHKTQEKPKCHHKYAKFVYLETIKVRNPYYLYVHLKKWRNFLCRKSCLKRDLCEARRYNFLADCHEVRAEANRTLRN